MSAIVCGKRTIFEELSSPQTTKAKRIRYRSSSLSPPRPAHAFNPFASASHLENSSFGHFVEQLVAIFPDMDKQVLERVLEECGEDLDLAIKSLNELRLGSADNGFRSAQVNSDSVPEAYVQAQVLIEAGNVMPNADAPPTEDPSDVTQLPVNGAEWVELFVREMMSASTIDDARARALRALEAVEKSICARAGVESSKNVHQENLVLKEQLQALIQENSILKRAVAIQHERHKEFEERNQEFQHLKELVSQYQEQLRTLEVNNYALTMHLKQAQQSSSIPGRFHPDVF